MAPGQRTATSGGRPGANGGDAKTGSRTCLRLVRQAGGATTGRGGLRGLTRESSDRKALDGPAMRPTTPPAAENGVGKPAALVWRLMPASGKESVANSHPHFGPAGPQGSAGTLFSAPDQTPAGATRAPKPKREREYFTPSVRNHGRSLHRVVLNPKADVGRVGCIAPWPTSACGLKRTHPQPGAPVFRPAWRALVDLAYKDAGVPVTSFAGGKSVCATTEPRFRSGAAGTSLEETKAPPGFPVGRGKACVELWQTVRGRLKAALLRAGCGRPLRRDRPGAGKVPARLRCCPIGRLWSVRARRCPRSSRH